MKRSIRYDRGFWPAFVVTTLINAAIYIGCPITEDNLILIAATVILLAMIAVCHRHGKRAAFMSLIVMIAYTAPLGYNLKCNSAGGAGFTWWFYLACLIAIQTFIMIIYIAVKYAGRNR